MNKSELLMILLLWIIVMTFLKPQFLTQIFVSSDDDKYSDQSLISKQKQMYEYLKDSLDEHFDH